MRDYSIYLEYQLSIREDGHYVVHVVNGGKRLDTLGPFPTYEKAKAAVAAHRLIIVKHVKNAITRIRDDQKRMVR